MGLIRVLPDAVANKIAAGEVVERPASVVKELLENSLDAGATRLRVEVAGGGRRLIRVSDDGRGMNPDDALLAFERHATSKLRDVDDLSSIQTLGFRGEALPSIASVSRLTLETRAEGWETGSRVEFAGGRLLHVQEPALPPGTVVAVKDLFFNVPARRKFLRTEKTELAHIASLVTHYSLAHVDKSFHLANEHGALLSAAPVADLRERVYQVFGSDTLEQLIELAPTTRALEVGPSPVPPTLAAEAAARGRPAAERREFALRGFISTPRVQKHSRESTYVFVNRRLIRDRMVLKAISSAYHNILPPGSFPFALLFLETPFDEVDVNVHPSKTEVRFRHQAFVYDFIRDSLRELLIQSKPVSSMPLPASPGQAAAALPYSEATRRVEEERPDDPVEVAPELRLRSDPPPPQGFDFESSAAIEVGRSSSTTAPGAPDFAADSEADAATEPATHSRAPLVDAPPRETLADVGKLRPLGQLQESFIVAVGPDGLWIIDQHVAHERILFEQVLENRRRERPSAQRLLLPLIVTLRPGQEIVYDRLAEELAANGFEIEPFGRRTIAVKAAPAELSPRQIETLLGEVLDTPEREMREYSLEDLQKRMAATIACHAAVKINMPLDEPKMRWMLDALAKTDCPMACPHGRPIALRYSLRDVLKAFHRL